LKFGSENQLNVHNYLSNSGVTRGFSQNIISALQVRRLEESTALNAKTEQCITAKLSGNE